MLSRPFVNCLLFLLLTACSNNPKKESPQLSQELPISVSATDDVEKDFTLFLEKFSKDSAFQRSRTKLPLIVKLYDLENDQDTILFKQSSEYAMMDFRSKKPDPIHDQWKQTIVLDKGGNKATIEIRGIENGIMVDYYFEKIDGQWMLVGVNDSST